MLIYIIILLLLFYLSYKYDVRQTTKNKQLSYYFVLVLFILLAGLRYRIGGDTVTYIYRYNYVYPLLKDFSFEDYPLGKDPLFVLLCALFKTCGCKFFVFQLFEACIVNFLIFKYFQRHTPYVFTCVLFYFLGFYLLYNTEILRGSFSIVLCLYGNDYIKNKRWILGLLLYAIGALFHAQTIVIFVTPLLFSCRFNKKGFIILFLLFYASTLLQNYIDSIFISMEAIDAVSSKGLYYSEAGGFTKSGNIVYFLVSMLPFILYILFSYFYLKNREGYNRIKEIEYGLYIGLLLYSLLINLGIVNRFLDYYRVYFAILYAETFIELARNGGKGPLNVRYIRSVLILLPLILLQFSSYLPIGEGVRYTPYSSVIEKSIDPQREKLYNDAGLYRPSPGEY